MQKEETEDYQFLSYSHHPKEWAKRVFLSRAEVNLVNTLMPCHIEKNEKWLLRALYSECVSTQFSKLVSVDRNSSSRAEAWKESLWHYLSIHAAFLSLSPKMSLGNHAFFFCRRDRRGLSSACVLDRDSFFRIQDYLSKQKPGGLFPMQRYLKSAFIMYSMCKSVFQQMLLLSLTDKRWWWW